MTALLLDTSAAIPLLLEYHDAHDVVVAAAADRPLSLPSHALAETYSVLTRLPGDDNGFGCVFGAKVHSQDGRHASSVVFADETTAKSAGSARFLFTVPAFHALSPGELWSLSDSRAAICRSERDQGWSG